MNSFKSNGAATKANKRCAIGYARSLTKAIECSLSPVDIFAELSRPATNESENSVQPLPNQMLLESSDVDSKKNAKSLIMTQAALRIECNERNIEIRALSGNGKNALLIIRTQLANYAARLEDAKSDSSKSANPALAINMPINSKLVIELNPGKNALDEDSRLKQLSPFSILRLINQTFTSSHGEFSLFLCGAFAYDIIASFESLPPVEAGFNSCPDYVFYLAETLIVLDHESRSKRVFCNHFSRLEGQTQNEEKAYYELARQLESIEQRLSAVYPTSNFLDGAYSESSMNDLSAKVCQSDIEFEGIVKQLKHNIIQGDIFQVVPSRRYRIPCLSPLSSYQELKRTNPSPYMFFMRDEKFSLFGASPESALKYQSKSNSVELYPIAGTRPRGKDENGNIELDLDARLEAELKLDEKELSEHMMLVDLARNDIAKISNPGTTYVPKLLSVDKYSQVMHLVSRVSGKLRDDLDALHAYQACMNMGTLTGAPKIRATELIRQSEKIRRGSYGGAVGYLNGRGDMDTCIVIRSAFYQNGIAEVQAGAGVVYDSNPTLEAQETENKAKAVINAVNIANHKIIEGK